MPRPPSKHGLERKYKPWRRGKSATAKKKSRSSLKNQLRGKERLLAKLPTDQDDERHAELVACIQQLKEEMSQTHEKERQRKNAVESHGTRFLERQRLTRMEKTTRKLWEKACEDNTGGDKERFEEELRRTALDQVYVAHYPHEEKYYPLFRKGIRVVDKGKAAHRRASIRQRILQQLANQDLETVKWIASDQYKRVPSEWTVDMEVSTFGTGGNEEATDGTVLVNDDRFALNQQHSALLEAAEKLESTLDESKTNDASGHADPSDGDDQNDERNISGDDSSSSDEDEADPLKPKMVSEIQADAPSPQDSSSSDDESDASSTSSSSSSSSSDESSDDNDEENTNTTPTNAVLDTAGEMNSMPVEEEDDFLVPAADDEPTNVFEKAKQHVPAWDDTKGDKSRGWATQRQRPEERKRRRMRR